MMADFFNWARKSLRIFSKSIAILLNSILLTFAYFIGIGLASIIARLVGKHFLGLKPSKKGSYWRDAKKNVKMKGHYRQF